ncbi:MAG: hypothetical protein J6Q21_01735 [Alistipes sp.]|jgi:hypothetical protein|nr:hypothetical protein [Alistipes sp.]
MGLIENPKTYTGRDLETIFFRPMFAGESAEQLGIHTIYNMPVPTTIQMWSPRADILKEYSSGWDGGDAALRQQKTIELYKVKAEVGFSASDYFQQVYELITGRADVNLDDLTGTELEQAETEMFRRAIAESVRVTMWVGDINAAKYNKFNGFLTLAAKYAVDSQMPVVDCSDVSADAEGIIDLLHRMWVAAPPQLKALKAEGNLVYFLTTDLYDAYEQYLDQFGADGTYTDVISGRRELSYHGIKLVDMGVSQYMPLNATQASTFCILTDRRNLVLAVNTADYPGSEVRMWYNPDEMENRQRAIFMVGCEILDENLLVYADFANA